MSYTIDMILMVGQLVSQLNGYKDLGTWSQLLECQLLPATWLVGYLVISYCKLLQLKGTRTQVTRTQFTEESYYSYLVTWLLVTTVIWLATRWLATGCYYRGRLLQFPQRKGTTVPIEERYQSIISVGVCHHHVMLCLL